MPSCVIGFEGHVASLDVWVLAQRTIHCCYGWAAGSRKVFRARSRLLHLAGPQSLWFHLFFRCWRITEFAQSWPLAIAEILWVRKIPSGCLHPPQDKASEEHVYRHTCGGKLCPLWSEIQFPINHFSIGWRNKIQNPNITHGKGKMIWLLCPGSCSSDIMKWLQVEQSAVCTRSLFLTVHN